MRTLQPKAMIALLFASFSLGCQAPARPSATTEVGVFQSGTIKVRYATAGEGEPIVLLHGWMGDVTSWGRSPSGDPQLSPRPGYRIVALDLRGHGQSGKPHNPREYGPEMARDVIRLLDHLKIKRAHIVGYSMGSFVAGSVAAYAPERCQSVTYGGGAPVLDLRAIKGFSDAEAFANAVNSPEGIAAYIIAKSPSDRPKPTLAEANQIAQQLYANQDLKALAACGRAFPDLEVKAATLKKKAIPTHFVYGAEESPFVLDRIREAESALPFAQSTPIPATNHITALTHPMFGNSVIAFIKKHPINTP